MQSMNTITLEHIIMFVSHLYAEKLSPNTITSYLASLSYILKLNGLPDFPSHFLVSKMLSGAQRLSAKPDTRYPITVTVLKQIVDALKHVAYSFQQHILFRAMFLLAFHAFLRVGEITSRNDKNAHLLQFSDIKFSRVRGKDSLVLTMSSYKHNVSKQPVSLEIFPILNSLYCPVMAIKKYLALRGHRDGPLFCDQILNPITRSEFCSVLKAALSFAGYDTKKYKAHSFRIGAATTAHSMGIPESQIKVMGRWHSDSYHRYIRVPMLKGLQTEGI